MLGLGRLKAYMAPTENKTGPGFYITLAPWTLGNLTAKWGERVPAPQGFMKTKGNGKSPEAAEGAGRWEQALRGALQPVLPRPPHRLPGVPSKHSLCPPGLGTESEPESRAVSFSEEALLGTRRPVTQQVTLRGDSSCRLGSRGRDCEGGD